MPDGSKFSCQKLIYKLELLHLEIKTNSLFFISSFDFFINWLSLYLSCISDWKYKEHHFLPPIINLSICISIPSLIRHELWHYRQISASNCWQLAFNLCMILTQQLTQLFQPWQQSLGVYCAPSLTDGIFFIFIYRKVLRKIELLLVIWVVEFALQRKHHSGPVPSKRFARVERLNRWLGVFILAFFIKPR